MTDDARELAFQRNMELKAPYFEVVRANGDIPWFEDPEKLARLEERCPGISQTPGEPARRQLFMTRYERETRTA